jgi:hypothetical protein
MSVHPEMAGEEQHLEEVLRNPDIVVEAESGSRVLVYHRLLDHPSGRERYLRVVVKCEDDGCFLLTAHVARKVKLGTVRWTKK